MSGDCSGVLDSGVPGVEFYLSSDLSRLVHHARLEDNQFVSCQIYLGAGPGPGRKAVVTEENLLTPDELRANKPAVDAAILEEFKIWIKYGVSRLCRAVQG